MHWLRGDHLGSASLTTNVSGQKVAELRYLPYGETRWAWGTTPTDRRYTGQRELAGVGLYDYNARMYWPAAGRFVSADTVVPDSTTPQSFNRYAYVLNNPLRYGDPTGHCPAPPPEFGPAICFALFIKPSEIAAGPVIVHGDGRDFSKDSNPAESRAWVWISTVEKDKVILGMNPTGYVFGDHIAWVSPAADNKLEAKRSDTGAIEVSYDLVLSGFLQDIAPHINGWISFEPDEKAGRYVAYGERDGFPWAEAYYHDGKGRVQTIFQRQAIRGNPDDLDAIEKQYGPLEKPGHWLRRKFISDKQPRRDEICTPGKPC